MVASSKPIAINNRIHPAMFRGTEANMGYSPFTYGHGIPSPMASPTFSHSQHAPVIGDEFPFGSPTFLYPPQYPFPPFPMPLGSPSSPYGVHYGIPFGSSPPPNFYPVDAGAEYGLYAPPIPPQQYSPLQYEDQWQQYQSVVVYPVSYAHNQIYQMLCDVNQEDASQWNYQPELNQLMKKSDSMQAYHGNGSNLLMKCSEVEANNTIVTSEPSGTTVTPTNFAIEGSSSWTKPRGPFKKRIRTASMPSLSSQQKHFCAFCKSNRETREWYESHVLKSKDGITCCPILRKYVCPKCNATGVNAHTLRYCPENTEEKEPLVRRSKSTSSSRPLRNSRGIVGSYNYN